MSKCVINNPFAASKYEIEQGKGSKGPRVWREGERTRDGPGAGLSPSSTGYPEAREQGCPYGEAWSRNSALTTHLWESASSRPRLLEAGTDGKRKKSWSIRIECKSKICTSLRWLKYTGIRRTNWIAKIPSLRTHAMKVSASHNESVTS